MIESNKKVIYKTKVCKSRQCQQIMLERSGLFGKDIKETFENALIDDDNSEIYTFLQSEWDLKSWLYIYSRENGNGKSYTGNAIANMLISRGTLPYVIREVDMATQVQNTFSDSTGESEYALMGKWKCAPVLIIQDFGKYGVKKDSEWWPQHIYDIIDYRVIEGKPLVITSNYDIASLEVMEKRFGSNHGPAIRSRLLGQCEVWNMFGADRRLGAVS